MNLNNIIIQFAVLYAPLMHGTMEQVTANIARGPDPKVKKIYELHEKGIKTIISLRTNPETRKQKLCQKLGMEWCQIKTGVFKTPSDEQFDQFRAIVNDPQKQPCYVSCEIDMDRTGVYIAAYRMVDQHWTSEQMTEEFSLHHQKKWWPIFRKYEDKVIAYARKRKSQADNNATLSTAATTSPTGDAAGATSAR